MPKDGDRVSVHYTGTLEDGTEFDTSRGGEPFTFELGAGAVIPGFEEAVRPLEVGQKTTVTLSPEQAYGQPDPALVLEVPADRAPEGLNPGDRVMLGNGVPATVVEVSEEVVKIDANHPLAGRSLTFEVELVSVG
jgi:FKBP-type peptidyl-prolyl cis-trans isomerase 2